MVTKSKDENPLHIPSDNKQNNNASTTYKESIILSIFILFILYHALKSIYTNGSFYLSFVIPIALLLVALYTVTESSTIGNLHYLRSIALFIISFLSISYFKSKLSIDITKETLIPMGCNQIETLSMRVITGALLSSAICILMSISFIKFLVYIKNIFIHYQIRYNRPYPFNKSKLYEFLNSKHNSHKLSENPSILMTITISEVLTFLFAFTQIATTPEIETMRSLISELASSNCHQIFKPINEINIIYLNLLNGPTLITAEIYATLQLLTSLDKSGHESTRRDERNSIRIYNHITDYFRSILKNQPIRPKSHPIFPLFIFGFALFLSTILHEYYSPFKESAPFISLYLAILATFAYITIIYPYKFKKNRSNQRNETEKTGVSSYFIFLACGLGLVLGCFLYRLKVYTPRRQSGDCSR